MFRVLPLLIIALVVGAVTWLVVLAPAEDPPGLQPKAQAEADGPSLPAATEAAVGISSGSESHERKREGTTQGRPIRVVNQDGEALAGVAVRYIELGAPDSAGRLFSGEEGKLVLPIEGPGIARAEHGPSSGSIEFDALDPAEVTELILRLEEYEAFCVEVVDPSGEAVEGVEIRRRARLRSADLDWSGFGPSVRTNEEGKAWFPVSPSEDDLRRLRPSVDEFEFEVMVHMDGFDPVTQPIAAEQREDIRLTLPSCGAIEVTLKGYPEHTIPVLHLQQQEQGLRARNGRLNPELQPTAEGAWRFPRVPLGGEFDVSFSRRIVQPDGGYRSSSIQMRRRSLTGPSFEGELVQASLEAEMEAVLTGRLLRRNGKPPKHRRNWGNPLSAVGLRTGGLQGERMWPFSILLEEDGTFRSQPVDPREGDPFPLSDFETFLIQSRVPMKGDDPFAQPEEWEWIRVPLQVPEGQATVDLGDLIVSTDDALLTVHCVDAAGKAISGASVRILQEVLLEGETLWRGLYGFKVDNPRTNAEGMAYGFGFDPETLETVRGILGRTDRFRVAVSHPEYLPTEQVVQGKEQIVRLELKKGLSVEGVVRVPRALQRARVFAVPSGAELPADSRLGAKGGIVQASAGIGYRNLTDLSRGMDAAESTFRLSPLSDDPIDLVFTLGDQDLEAHRIVGIQPAAEPRLAEVVDLMAVIDSYQIELYALDGQRVTNNQRHGVSVRQLDLDATGYSGGMSGMWDDLIYVFAPRGEDPHTSIGQPGARYVACGSLTPGRSVVRLQPTRVTHLRFERPEGFPDGAAVRLEVWGGMSAEQAPLGEGADLSLTFPGAGTYGAIWRLTSAEGRRLGTHQSKLVITDAMLDAEGPVAIPVPRELLPKD